MITNRCYLYGSGVSWPVDVTITNRCFVYWSGVSWPVDVKFAAHQLGESLTIIWKHPPCDQTNYISGYVIAYRKLADIKCNSTLAGWIVSDTHT